MNELLGDFLKRTVDVYESNKWNKYPQAIPDNATLKRYLNRCNWDLDYAEKTYRKMLEWREINNINGIIYDVKYPDTPVDEGSIVLNPFNHEFYDYYGIPIEIMKISKINFHNLDIDEILNYLILKEETLFQKYDISDKSMILIYDFKDFIINLQFVMSVLPKLAKISQVMDDYYAGRARKIYIVNAPSLFDMAYKLGSSFIPEHTKEMTNIYTSQEPNSADLWTEINAVFGFTYKSIENFKYEIVYDTPDHQNLIKYLFDQPSVGADQRSEEEPTDV